MELGLNDKVALVTGSSKGIGLAVARELAAEGCKVVLTARSGPELVAAAHAISDAGGAALPVRADACSEPEIEKTVAEAVAHYGTIHILINNVGGVDRFAPFDDLSDDEWHQAFDLNVLSAVRFSRRVLPYMRRQRWGRIVNIASESGIQPDAEMPHYNCAKAALIAMGKGLSKSCAADGILVNTVSPAFIRTPLVMAMMRSEAERRGIGVDEVMAGFLRERRPHIELKRPGEEFEVAKVVAFLASEAASFVTGANYRVDGGSVASI